MNNSNFATPQLRTRYDYSNNLYPPSLPVANGPNTPSAPVFDDIPESSSSTNEIHLLETKEFKAEERPIDWQNLNAVELKWHEQTKIRNLVSTIFLSFGALSAGACIFSATLLIATPQIIIGATLVFGILTAATLITGTALRLIKENPLDADFRMKKRLELKEKVEADVIPPFSSLETYIEKQILSDEDVQSILFKDIQNQSYSDFIKKHGEKALQRLDDKNTITLKLKYIASVIYDPAHTVKTILNSPEAKFFNIQDEEILKIRISFEVNLLNTPEGNYDSFISRNSLKMIKHASSEHKKILEAKFCHSVLSAMFDKGAIDAEKTYAKDFEAFAPLVKENVCNHVVLQTFSRQAKDAYHYSQLLALNGWENMQCIILSTPEISYEMRQAYLKLSFTEMQTHQTHRALLRIDKESIKHSLLARWSDSSIENILKTDAKDFFLSIQTGILPIQMFASKLEREIQAYHSFEDLLKTYSDSIFSEQLVSPNNDTVMNLAAKFVQDHSNNFLHKTYDDSLTLAVHCIEKYNLLPQEKQKDLKIIREKIDSLKKTFEDRVAAALEIYEQRAKLMKDHYDVAIRDATTRHQEHLKPLEEFFQDMTAIYAQSNQDLETHLNQLEAKDGQLNQLRINLENRSTQLAEKNEGYAALNTKYADLRANLEILQSQIREKTHRINQLENSLSYELESSPSIKGIKANIETLNASFNNTRQSIADQQKLLDNHTNNRKCAEECDRNIARLEQDIRNIYNSESTRSSLKKDIRDAKLEIARLEQVLLPLKIELDGLKNQMRQIDDHGNLITTQQQKQKKLAATQLEITNLDSAIKNNESQRKSAQGLGSSINILLFPLESNKEKLTTLQREKKELKNQLSALTKQIETNAVSTQKMAGLKQKRLKVQQTYDRHSTERECLLKTLQENQKTLAALEVEMNKVSSYRDQVQRLKSQRPGFNESTVQGLENSLLSLNQSLQIFQLRLVNEKNQLKEKQNEIAQKYNITGHKDELLILKANLQKTKQIQNQKSVLLSSIETLRITNTQLELEILETERALLEANNETQPLQDKAQHNLSALEGAINRRDNELQAFNSYVSTSTNIYEKEIATILEEQEKDINAITAKYNSTVKEIEKDFAKSFFALTP